MEAHRSADHDDTDRGPFRCLYCGEPCELDDYEPYCSEECGASAAAEEDDE